MIQFRYDFNSETLTKGLANFQAALADNAPALAEIADDFRAMIADQFSTEGRAGGTPWPPLAPPARRGTGVPPVNTRRMRLPLVRTGALRDSLVDPDAPMHVEEVDAQSVSLGTRVPYAILHQLGTRRMPGRPIIVLSDERSAQWTEIVRSAIEQTAALLGAKEMAGGKL